MERTASQRGKSNRRRGQDGERELANTLGELLGITLKRRVRNHEGESDITGLEGFSVEVKRQATPSLRTWWSQTVTQAAQTGEIPVLFYRLPRRDFKAVISLHPFLDETNYTALADYEMTIEMSLPAFAAVYRFTDRSRGEREIAMRDHLGIKVN